MTYKKADYKSHMGSGADVPMFISSGALDTRRQEEYFTADTLNQVKEGNYAEFTQDRLW